MVEGHSLFQRHGEWQMPCKPRQGLPVYSATVPPIYLLFFSGARGWAQNIFHGWSRAAEKQRGGVVGVGML
jgi:hypothetical protein